MICFVFLFFLHPNVSTDRFSQIEVLFLPLGIYKICKKKRNNQEKKITRDGALQQIIYAPTRLNWISPRCCVHVVGDVAISNFATRFTLLGSTTIARCNACLHVDHVKCSCNVQHTWRGANLRSRRKRIFFQVIPCELILESIKRSPSHSDIWHSNFKCDEIKQLFFFFFFSLLWQIKWTFGMQRAKIMFLCVGLRY